ncbi:MAG: hypothetical protein FWF18_00340 [Dehalococcoidia bacterium]|nr:hypothetical protein [Dehalococcoidia bacterium]
MAKSVKPPTLDNLQQRLDMFDDRLDNLDSMISAVIERVMNQALTVQTVCPHCNRNAEIALIGVRKPKV